MIKSIFIVFLVCIFCNSLNAQRAKYNFNSGWNIFVGNDAEVSMINNGDEDWKPVMLPYTGNKNEAGKPNE